MTAPKPTIANPIERAVAVAGKATARYGAFSSPHEILGVMEEEFMELKESLWRNDWQGFREELIDIAAVCIRAASESTTREDKGQL